MSKSYGGYVKTGKSKTDIFAEKLNANFEKEFNKLKDDLLKEGYIIMTIPNIDYSKMHISDYVKLVKYQDGKYKFLWGGNITFKNNVYFSLKPINRFKFHIQWKHVYTLFIRYSDYTKNVLLKLESQHPEMVEHPTLPMPIIDTTTTTTTTTSTPTPTPTPTPPTDTIKLDEFQSNTLNSDRNVIFLKSRIL